MRLVGGKDKSQGRVEMYHAGKWGTVCKHNWDSNDAQVVCRSLGFISGDSVTSVSNFEIGSGEIWFDNVACDGTERRLQDCSHSGLGLHNCSHHEDAGVMCSGKFFYHVIS